MHIGIVSPVSTAHLSEYLYLTGNEPAGTEGTTAPNLLIIELLNRGYKISVFSLSREITREYVINGKNITIYYLPFRLRARNYTLDFYRKERQYLKNKIQEVKPDVLHAHWQYENAWAAVDSGIRTIVTCRDSPVKVFLLNRKLFWFIRLVVAYIVLKKAKIITATSAYLSDELKKFGVREAIEIIPNFEPDWLFSKPILNKDLRYPKIIMINNGFDNRKNVKVAIEAFQLLRIDFPLAELHLYGHSYEPDGEANIWASSQCLNENVYYKGYGPFLELMDELRTFTMLVHPSREETFGNILTESMALGVPVIGGINSGAVPWVIGTEQKGGLLVDINSKFEICTAMANLISSQHTYEQYSFYARKQAQDNFSVEKVIELYTELYAREVGT